MGNIREIMRDANQSGDEEYRREVQRRAQVPNRNGQLPRNIQEQRKIGQPVRNMQSQRMVKSNVPVPKRDIRNKPTTSKKDKKIRRAMAVGLAALAFAGVAAGIGGCGRDNNPEQPAETIIHTINIPTDINKNEIKTIDDVKEDFKEQYLKAYNEEYKTQYTNAEMYVNHLSDGWVYKLNDGKIVTRGVWPDKTEQTLNELGGYTDEKGYDVILQMVSEGGEILGSYNTSTGEFIYSGNQLEDLTDINFEEPTLGKLGISSEMVKTAADVVMSRGQREESTRIYINRYKVAKEENEKQQRPEIDVKDYDGDER